MSNRTVTIDFETKAIEGNPLVTPPMPVGVSIKRGTEPSHYHHGDLEELRAVLLPIWESECSMVFHNAPFDLRVAEEWLQLPRPYWRRVHDTTFLIYLFDPHAKTVSLKPSAERILEIDPEERDELQHWIMTNIKGATSKTWGAYISEAPLALVSRYAEADTNLTWELFRYLRGKVPANAYDLERELQPHLTDATVRGIRVDWHRLAADYTEAVISLNTAEKRIHELLGGEFDVHNGAQLADALDKAGVMREWKLTQSGKRRSTARANLIAGIHSGNEELLNLLSYAGAMRTCANTFMSSWLQLSERDGRLHPSWNQVRNDDYGTRTGRLSCSQPNLQNVPKPFELNIPNGCVPIPRMRDYLLPEKGDIWFSRDFSAQEVRLLAHFEGGELLGAFVDDPEMDPHQMVSDRIAEAYDIEVSRKAAKAIAFGIIYGMGVPSMAKQLGLNYAEADEVIQAYHATFPGVSELQRGSKLRGKYATLKRELAHLERQLARAKADANVNPGFLKSLERTRARRIAEMPPCDTIRTIGGRFYRSEPSKTDSTGKKRTFEYKLLNYLIQGSAADQTKMALVEYFRRKPEHETFLCTVHDEINVSSTADSTVLQTAMERGSEHVVDAPMSTTLEQGPTWGAIK